MVDAINGINAKGIDLQKLKKLTPQEIIQKKNQGEEIPDEIVAWAQDIVRFDGIPDDVTYDLVDGSTGVEALNELGLPSDEVVENTEGGEDIGDEENPDGTVQPPEAKGVPGEEDAPPPIPDEDDDIDNPDNFDLSNSDITADNDEIRKRKERKGIQQ